MHFSLPCSETLAQAIEAHPGLQWALALLPSDDQEIVAYTPYSLVLKITAKNGAVFYCKISPMEFSSEAEILRLFEAHQVPGAPKLFASNEHLSVVVQYDAGQKSLEKECSGAFSAQMCDQVFRAYRDYQKCSVPSSLSLPRWGSEALFENARTFFSQGSDFFKNCNFAQEEQDSFHQILPSMELALKAISGAQLALNHSDFHDKNIVLGPPSILAIIDWSECVLAHPDFSKWAFFHKMRQKYGAAFDVNCVQVVEKYLDFPEHASFVQALLPLYLALNDWRLLQAVCEKDGTFSKKLQERIVSRIRDLGVNMNLLLGSGQLH